MNHNRYRLVFNRARGVCMAVAEICRGGGGAGDGVTKCPSAALGGFGAWLGLLVALWVGMGLAVQPAPAWAQSAKPMQAAPGLKPIGGAGASMAPPAAPNPAPTLQADPKAPAHLRPAIGQAANGVPLINIQTPSAAGVSRNLYQQFDLQAPGAILNNSRTNTPTLLGGWVQGNPKLGQGSARIILNEVNSNQPSLLQGHLETAGPAAQVIIANPAGIHCKGCGFINASRATLTTGTPFFNPNNGQLQGYRVQGGSITLDGAGLDTSTTPFTDLIARALNLNAGLWAQDLKLITGPNTLAIDPATGRAELQTAVSATAASIGTGASTGTHTPSAAPTNTPSAAPSYAIDSSALGGMYAGRIAIVATEAGVGVRHAGKAYATAADLSLHSAGPVYNSGELIGQTQLQLNTQSLTNIGTLSAPLLGLNAQSFTNLGPQAQLLANNATLNIQTTLDNLAGATLHAQNLAIQAQSLTNQGGVDGPTQASLIAARQRLDLGVGTLANLNHALIYSEGDLAIGGSLEPNPNNTTNLNPQATPRATGQARQITNHGATLQAQDNIRINTQTLNNTNANFATTQEQLAQETITEYQGAGSPKRYTPGSPGVAIYNDESDHLQTPEGNYSDWTAYTYTRTTHETRISQSQPGQIISGGDLTLNADTVLNDKSTLLAGASPNGNLSSNNTGTLSGNIGTLTNTDVPGERTVTDSGTATSYWRRHRKGRDETGSSAAAYTPAPTIQAISLNPILYPGVAENSTSTGSGSGPNATQGANPSTSPSGNSSNATPVVPNSTATAAAQRLAQLNTDAPIPIPLNTLAQALQNPSIQHLIETDPAFTQYRNWISSDPVLKSLLGQQLNPDLLQKRLGDMAFNPQLSFAQLALIARALNPQAADPQNQDEDSPNKPKGRNKKTAQAAEAAQAQQNAQALLQTLTNLAGPAAAPSVAQAAATPAKPSTAANTAPSTTPGAIQSPGGLIAGNTINLNIGQTLTNSGTILAQNTLALNTNTLNNQGGHISASTVALNAAQDLTSSGTLAATQSLQASAGRDLTLASTTRSTTSNTPSPNSPNNPSPNTRTHIDQQASVRVGNTAANTTASPTPSSNPSTPTLSLQAGRDLSLNAATLTNQTQGATALAAQANINLGTVAQSQSTQIHWDANNHRSEHHQTAQGSTLNTQAALTLQAGQDITAQAASLTTQPGNQNGTLQARAGRNLALQAANQRTQIDERHQHQGRSGPLAKTTTSRRDTLDQTTAQGSTLSAATLNLQAGQDLSLSAGQLVSDQGTALHAGRTLSIATATQTQHQSQQRSSKKTGVFSGGGIALTAGTQAQSLDQTTTTQTAATSTVGSLQGNTTLQAGQAYQQQGGDILSPQGNIQITAPSIAITEAREHSTQTTQQQFKQSGITVAISNPVLAAIDTIQQQKDAAKQSADPRYQALAAANIALAARGAVKAVTGAGAGAGVGKNGTAAGGAGVGAAAGSTGSTGPLTGASDSVAKAGEAVGGLNLSLTVGKSSSQSQATVQQNTALGALLQAGGDVQLLAGGDTDPLTLQGSTVRAGRNIQITTPGNITAQAAPNTRSQRSTNSSQSASVGGSIGTDGLLFTASASRGKGNANGDEATWTNTQLQAGQTLSLQSGGDTTLQGTVASAQGITAQVGGNLALQSLQDTETYQSQQRNIGASLAVGAGRGSGSLSVNKADIQSDYRSVQDPTRLEAGDAGFDIDVQGNTTLVGAQITSTESAVRAGSNRFTTKTLTTQDLNNTAQYSGKAVGLGVGLGGSGGMGGGVGPGLQGGSIGLARDTGSASSTTQAGITGTAGNSKARSGQIAKPLAKPKNGEALQRQLQAQSLITQTFGKEASKAVADYASAQLQRIQTQQRQEAQADNPNLDTLQALINAKAAWEEGGTYRVALHTVVGALGGGLHGAAGAGTAAAAAPSLNALQDHLAQSLEDAGLEPTLAKSSAQAIAGTAAAGLGAIASGGRVVGAATAVNADLNNRQLHLTEAQKLAQLKKGKTREQQQRLDAAACALVRCAEGVPADDPHHAKLLALQTQGQTYQQEQIALLNTGEFIYQPYLDASRDFLTRHGETQQRLSGALDMFAGTLGSVGGGTLAAAGAVGCAPSAGASCALVPLGTYLAIASNQQAQEGNQALLGNYAHTEGKRVLSSFNPKTHPGDRDPLKEVAGDAAMLGLTVVAGKLIPQALARAEGLHFAASKQSASEFIPAADKAKPKPDQDFQTLGLEIRPMRLQGGVKMVRELENVGLSYDDAIKSAASFIRSGSTPPVAISVNTAEKLLKVVPAGGQPSPTTGYWLSESEWAVLQKDPSNLASKLALPPGMQVSNYDIYQIQPKENAVVFQSKIAPTLVDGKPDGVGGAMQTIVVNRSQFTTPIKVGSVSTKKGN